MIEAPPLAMVRAFLPVYQWLLPRLNFLIDQGGIPTSWFRDPVRNARAGGSVESQHLLGFAADFVPGASSWIFLRDQAARTGLIAVLETDHLHVQIFPAGKLREAGLFQNATV